MAVLAVDGGRVTWANRAARDLFRLNLGLLPLGVMEVVRDARLEDAIAFGPGSEREVELVHHRRTVAVRVGPGPGTSHLAFVADVTQLRRLERVRREFVGNLSHEIRTPLASLSLAAESLLGDPPAEVRRRFAQRVVDEAGQLSSILANLGALAAIETGEAEIALSEFPLAELVAEVAARAGAAPGTDQVPPDLRVTADRGKIAQVLGNLIDNAVKFSPPGSPVEVSAARREGEVVVTVRDHGPGLSPEHWEKVFERLYKVDPARPRGRGSGLGLAIAKHLVLAHHGRIWTSLAPGGGQLFSVSIPSVRTSRRDGQRGGAEPSRAHDVNEGITPP